ncbi:MAG: DNA primase DnaG [Candidatus Micrarchaeia archaeon]
MGKTYIDTVKYLVYANVKVEGLVDKPDIVGAIFGQTEGLLGEELDLRDLQKNGRIGRIEVDKNPNAKSGLTDAVIKIPSSLDMVETCIIAAALEAVDRVGPCEAHILVDKIEDTRSIKRKNLIDRAKGLLKSLIDTELPESKELSENVRDEVKKAEITIFGPDRLPAGPGIDKSNEVIIVEGRADVLNLLKNDVTNVIAMQGARVLPTIIELTKKKETTLFLDGDRGGDLIVRSLVEAGAEIDFVARAPRGKEVEELTRKELIKYLRNKIPFDQEMLEAGKRDNIKPFRQQDNYGSHRDFNEEKMNENLQRFSGPEPVKSAIAEELKKEIEKPSFLPKRPRINIENSKRMQILQKNEGFEFNSERKPAIKIEDENNKKVIKKISEGEIEKELEELKDTLQARMYNENLELLEEIKVRDVIKFLEEKSGVSVIIFDGIITQRLVDLAYQRGVKRIFGSRIGNVNKTPDGIMITTRERK